MKSLIQVAVVGSALACHALPEVVNVKVEPISPWGKAYVTFGINEDFETNDTAVAIMAHLVASNRQTHVIYEHVCKMDSLARENNHVLWDMQKGKRYFLQSELDFQVKLEAWVQLWENGPYWAECNLGAFAPEDAGYSFWWGDIIGYRKNDVGQWMASDGSSSNFEFSASSATTYGTANYILKERGVIVWRNPNCWYLLPEYDAAHTHWGAGCRMPTDSEISLLSQCILTWTRQNGCFGYLVKGKGDFSTKEIFLPVTSDETGKYWTSRGGWSSTSSGQTDETHLARDLTLDLSHFGMTQSSPNTYPSFYGIARYSPCAIRAVLDMEK